ncbi:hypothetical protein HG436_000280 [Candidatus Saccharibacteria bacterium]|nr:hypothetical protein [Candidatus Saccharibacteria bacterium]
MIDVWFDCRQDANGKDPDQHSPTLKRYHAELWAKPLPDGRQLTMLDQGSYLIASDGRCQIPVSSDNMAATFRSWKRNKLLVEKMPRDVLTIIEDVGWTIGSEIIFPSELRGGTQTINRARGWHRKIGDRFDLTLECIARWYQGKDSPLADVFDRYDDFFEWFGDFQGYVDFFLLQDFVDDEYQVKILTDFDGFQSSPLPKTVEQYTAYLQGLTEVLTLRAERIERYAN